MDNNNNVSTYIHNFYQGHLKLNGSSQNTIWSYRDTIKLLFKFSAAKNKKSADDLNFDDLNPDMIVDFLDHLEKERNNAIQTRNNRLSCIHSFFRYVYSHDPLVFNKCYRILTIPFKRTVKKSTIKYLEVDEMKAIFYAIDCRRLNGYRDYTLFMFMCNTGARVQEVISLPPKNVRLEKPFEVKLQGKGEKERICPLWPETARLLHLLIKQRKLIAQSDDSIFVNQKGNPFTRHGIRYLLNKYVKVAAKSCPSLKQKCIHPHTLRHSCAHALLKAGVDINTVRAWLGHVNIETTNEYAKLDPEMMRQVLNNYVSMGKGKRPWKENKKLMDWLTSL